MSKDSKGTFEQWIEDKIIAGRDYNDIAAHTLNGLQRAKIKAKVAKHFNEDPKFDKLRKMQNKRSGR